MSKVYVKYAVEKAKGILCRCMRAATRRNTQISYLSAGCQQTESYEQADLFCAVTAPGEQMQEAAGQLINHKKWYEQRNLPEMIEFLKERIKET